jgi:hypothetical protein
MPLIPNGVDAFSPRLWTGVVRTLPVPTDYIFDRFLPEQDVAGYKLEWDVIGFENGLAPFVALGAESPRMDRQQYRKAFADIVFMREKVAYEEPDMVALRYLGDPPVPGPQANMRAAALKRIADDTKRLRLRIDARREWMRVNSLLGAMTVTANGESQIRFSVSYPVGTQTAAPLWSDTVNSDPIRDIATWTKGLLWKPRYCVLSLSDMFNLQSNTKLRQSMLAASGVQPTLGSAVLTPNSVSQFFESQFGITFITYNAQYTTATDSATAGKTVTAALFLPEGKAIFLPADPVGYFATGPAVQNDYQTGFFTWTRDPHDDPSARDPWRYELGVGYYGLPIIEHPEQVIVATVA